ncbi:tRNA modification GTPase [Aureliella helgolandensis]|uniref:tRNA modification GTPase MnmE n=1 Tax=Aureliella helgolandensis TaxID=2527968 RepID=A0A518G024_9BACT|nr:GTPase [Aureliella helgolandensis]QDV21955.1 tRNA modification GTPase MnmE [Aureliella helgolandensis]
MKLDLQRTIVAVSSAIAPARRAIVRLSGQETGAILARLLIPACSQQAAVKQTLLASNRALSGVVDCDLGLAGRTIESRVYYWPNARSFTGEPCAELHLLGSLPLVELLTEQIASLGALPASRGEFTLRSFLAGKIDLTQAEAVLGVIEAESDDQLSVALGQLGGNLSTPIRQLRNQLLEVIAHLEAGLDFVEEDIEFISVDELQNQLREINTQLHRIAQQLQSRGSRSRTPQLLLVGLPNAGKSSLFNALVGSDRAIVSAQAGTTRDAISQRIEFEELTVELIDTAGMEELQEATPRALAQRVLQDRLSTADLILFCIDLSENFSESWLVGEWSKLRALGTPMVVVGTKLDAAENRNCEARLRTILGATHRPNGELEAPPATTASAISGSSSESQSPPSNLDATPIYQAISVHDAATIADLVRSIRQTLASKPSNLQSDAMHRAMLRCRSGIEQAIAAIAAAMQLNASQEGEELVASELRVALEDLSSVIGEVHNEDILGEIFGRFCIGK